jgi:hypothetical protein
MRLLRRRLKEGRQTEDEDEEKGRYEPLSGVHDTSGEYDERSKRCK